VLARVSEGCGGVPPRVPGGTPPGRGSRIGGRSRGPDLPSLARMLARGHSCRFGLLSVGFLQPMRTRRALQLADASRRRLFVRLRRRFEESPTRGYVIEVDPRWFLLGLVSDCIWLNGYQCFRVQDTRKIEADPYAAFEEAALRKRGERRPRNPRVSVVSIEDLLLSAGRAFPLVTIHRERVDPDVCWIGRVLGVERGRVSLLEINPDATWDKRPHEYRMGEITRVDFGGDYENALHLVGGDPLVL